MTERRMIPIRMPTDLLDEIDKHAGPRGRSEFIIEASRRELLRQRQAGALSEAAGAWKDQDYPELATADTVEGLNTYLRKLRREAERREEGDPGDVGRSGHRKGGAT